ncbi:MAG TPA: hypothetical protein VHZ24_13765 [Pirellulales bacterium]|nr:hypothetical protein [Pirellulales bacterium]
MDGITVGLLVASADPDAGSGTTDVSTATGAGSAFGANATAAAEFESARGGVESIFAVFVDWQPNASNAIAIQSRLIAGSIREGAHPARGNSPLLYSSGKIIRLHHH